MSHITKDDLRALIREEVSKAQNQSNVAKINDKAIKDHAMHCPECFHGIISDMNKKSDYICDACGLPLGDVKMVAALDKCPNCNARNPKKNPFKEY